ncbi:MAG: exosortase/archaeosortase family protein [Candidatus Saccharicenans sp.]
MMNPKVDIFYTHIPLIPVISALLLYRKRKILFSAPQPALFPGILIALAAISFYLFARQVFPESEYSISLAVASAIIFWIGTYIALFGFASLKKAAFPVAFLIFAVPIPERIMNRIVVMIAGASVYITDFLFSLIHTPYAREGIEIYLPGYVLVVGPECAGWRSSIALVIISLLAAHLFLKKIEHKLLLVSIAVPLIIIKNSVRIIILYLISYYIDERFMEPGFIHRSVGYVLFIVVLIFMGFILWLLERRELREKTRPNPEQ